MQRSDEKPVHAGLRRVAAIVASAATALAAAALVALPADPARADTPQDPATVSADALPTWQINGVVWSQAVVGNTVYVTGSFTKARPPGVAAGGAGEIDANNVFAYDITTGTPVTNFSHSFDAQGLVVRGAPDGKTVYFGGDFMTVDGQARSHVAAFDVATGALTSWAPRTDGQVRAFAFAGNSVYAGGNFRSSNGQVRTELAAWDATTGNLTSWSPTADGDGFVWSMVTSPDRSRIIVSGSFTSLNGATAYGMGSLDATGGATMPWAAVDKIKSAGLNGAISSLSTDGTQVYGTGYAFGAGASFEGTFAADPYTGAINWINDCLGDTYDSFPQGQVLYSVSHHHDCSVVGGFPDTNPRSRWQKTVAERTYPYGTITKKDAYGWDFTGVAFSGQLHWYPDLEFGSYTNARQAAWTVTGNSDYVVMGGEFPIVNNVAQQGLVRFAKRSISPHTMGPINSTAFTPSPYSNESGIVRVPFSSVWDRDDTTITYDVFRSPSPGTKIATFTRSDSEFWKLPSLSITDTGQTPGAQVRYQVRAKDSDGNVQWSAWSPYVTVSGASTSAYRSAVRASGATHYWRLSESVGAAKVYDDVADSPGTVTSMTLGAAGALTNDTDTGVTSAGGSTPKITTADAAAADPAVSVEAWVKTTSTRGGRIVGYGDSATGTATSGNTDRVLYLDTSGRVNFAINDGSYRTIYSRAGINDGQWHHVVGTVGDAGMQLYVDGTRVGRDQNYTAPKSYVGYWRIGADQTSGFTNKPTDTGLAGSIDDVAVYAKAMTKADIQAHYAASGRTGAWSAAPTDAYGAAVTANQPDLYWRLNEASGAALDSATGGAAGTVSGTLSRGQSGAVTGDSAATFDGSSGLVVSQQAWNNPARYSAELWFKTTSTKGGKLIGFGNATSGLSSSYDRHVVMQSNGKLSFGSNNGVQNTVVTANSYNDGTWHHMVATQGADGMKLWVDSQLVGTNSATSGQNYLGYWRVGGDKTWGSTNSNYISGTLDEVAVYPTVLSEQDIRNHYSASGRTPVNRAPVASFTLSNNNLSLSVDATGSSDPDGNLTTYGWDFGDGSTVSGQTATHAYGQGGTYSVTLKVTDAGGLTNSINKSVTAVPNQAPMAAFTPTMDHLALSVDGSASSDPDGTVASYAWDFGDGKTGTGASASHTYDQPGAYQVSLTVTDDDGATNTTTAPVTAALPPNQAPKAAFSSDKKELKVTFDGSGSSDADGSVASYAWDFGDGQSDTGATASHTYGADGTYTVTLTVTDNRGGTDTVSHDVTVAANKKPTAAFSSSAADLKTSFDGSASTDADGTLASYAWDFGDGQSDTGATTSHSYAQAGTYDVKLTVTDNGGATDSVTKQVTVNAATIWAQDDFGRTSSNGWGTSDKGGAWAMNPGSSTALSKFSVSGGTGNVALSAGNNYSASLPNASASTNTEEKFAVTVDKAATGGGYYVSAIGRQIDTSNDYRAKVRVASTGVVTLWLTKTVSGAETLLTTTTVSGLTVGAGDTLNVRMQVTGTNSTTLKAKVWKSTASEPAGWTSTSTDGTSVLQAPGYVGVNSYLSGSASNGPVTYSYDGFWAGAPQ